MIPIEEQVTSLHWSKELVKRGIKIDSVWLWTNAHLEYHSGYEDWYVRDIFHVVSEKPYSPYKKNTANDKEWNKMCEIYPAPTVVELGEILPSQINLGWELQEPLFTIRKWEREDFGIYYEGGHNDLFVWKSNKRLGDALTEMLCWLKDNGYLQKERDR